MQNSGLSELYSGHGLDADRIGLIAANRFIA
jgi:hypothetical protein